MRRRGGDGAYEAAREWHAQNIKMVEALSARKYDVNFTWGIGTHSDRQGGQSCQKCSDGFDATIRGKMTPKTPANAAFSFHPNSSPQEESGKN